MALQSPLPIEHWNRLGGASSAPAKRSRRAADPVPTIQVDSREQAPLTITRFPVEVVGLPVGDYGIKGFSDWTRPYFAIERKSIDDLAGSLGRERDRFMREIEKLRQFRFAGLVIEADRAQVEMKHYVSQIAPSSILATLDALAVRCNLHVFWAGDRAGAAEQVESLALMFVRGIAKDYASLTWPTVSAEADKFTHTEARENGSIAE